MTLVSSSRFRFTALVLAGLAANVMVLSTGPVAANELLHQVASEGDQVSYPLMAAAGALVSAVFFAISGPLHNRLVRKLGNDRPVYLAALGITPLLGFLLSQASSISSITLLWCLIQVPAASLLAATTAQGLERVEGKRMGILAALFGISGVVAILYGSVLGAVFGTDIRGVILAGFATATLLIIPASLLRDKIELTKVVQQARGRINARIIALLFGVFATLCTVALSVDFFVQVCWRLGIQPKMSIGTAFLMSAVSSGIFLVVILVAGFIAKRVSIARALFNSSFGFMVIGLLLLGLAPNFELALLGAGVSGFGTALNIATQLILLRDASGNAELMGNQSGIYNLLTVLPGVLVPVSGAILTRVSYEKWTSYLALGIAALMVLALVVSVVVKGQKTSPLASN